MSAAIGPCCGGCALFEDAAPGGLVGRCLWALKTPRPPWSNRPAWHHMRADAGATCPTWTARPRRIQRRRLRGWKLPPGAICVTRPGVWSNPFRVVKDAAGGWCMVDRANGLLFPSERGARRQATLMFREQVTRRITEAARKFLRGHDLACFCGEAPDDVPDVEWCHASIWLEIANA